jgi:hypothetical protein
MASYRWGFDETFVANADLSSYQYYAVITGSTTGEVKVTSVASGSILGILQNDPKQGEEAVVRVFGFSKAKANGNACALTYGGVIRAASSGMIEGGVGGMTASAFTVGVAMQALASGSAVEVEVFVTPFGFKG